MPPVPDNKFEVHGSELYQLELAGHNKTSMLFYLKDTKNWVAWYKFVEGLPEADQRVYDLASVDAPPDKEPKLDRAQHIADGAGWEILKTPKRVRVDTFATSGVGSAHIVNTEDDTLGKKSLVVHFRIKPYQHKHAVYDLNLDFFEFEKPDSELKTLFGSVLFLKLERDGKTLETDRFRSDYLRG